LIEFSENIAAYIRKHFGDEYLERYIDFFNSPHTNYIRFSSKENVNEVILQIKNYGIELEHVSSSDDLKDAYKVVNGEELIGKTLQFILGKYYIQSLSSMIPALILKPAKSDVVLDLCAAPGSKTTQLSEMMENKGTLYANEISVDRIKSLVFNIEKMNSLNIGVINKKGELLSKSFHNYFDKILVDAPCSALGILQKKGEVNNWWNENKISLFSDIQYRLLLSALKMCKVGGEIVYSTCTLTLEENELVVNQILKNYPVEICNINLPVSSAEAFTKYNNEILNPAVARARRILPWEINSEGFFVAKFKKLDNIESKEEIKRNAENLELTNFENQKLRNLLSSIIENFHVEEDVLAYYKYLIKKNEIYFINKEWRAGSFSDFVRIGARLGLIDKNKKLQLFSLAAREIGEHIQKNIVELEDLNDLKVYLKGGIIKKNFGTVSQKLVKYKNEVIGTAVVTKDGLKSQFPRAFRTQEIVLHE